MLSCVNLFDSLEKRAVCVSGPLKKSRSARHPACLRERWKSLTPSVTSHSARPTSRERRTLSHGYVSGG